MVLLISRGRLATRKVLFLRNCAHVITDHPEIHQQKKKEMQMCPLKDAPEASGLLLAASPLAANATHLKVTPSGRPAGERGRVEGGGWGSG